MAPQLLQFVDALKSDVNTAAAKATPSEQLAELGESELSAYCEPITPIACYYTAASCMADGQSLLFAGRIAGYSCRLFDVNCPNNTTLYIC